MRIHLSTGNWRFVITMKSSFQALYLAIIELMYVCRLKGRGWSNSGGKILSINLKYFDIMPMQSLDLRLFLNLELYPSLTIDVFC